MEADSELEDDCWRCFSALKIPPWCVLEQKTEWTMHHCCPSSWSLLHRKLLMSFLPASDMRLVVTSTLHIYQNSQAYIWSHRTLYQLHIKCSSWWPAVLIPALLHIFLCASNCHDDRKCQRSAVRKEIKCKRMSFSFKQTLDQLSVYSLQCHIIKKWQWWG